MTQPIRVVLVDDERLARERLARLLERTGDYVVEAECGDGTSAVETIVAARPDLVFLDVQMPGQDGFAVAAALLERLGESLPIVVFVTAHDAHALRAFEAQALDYLVKPFDDARFAATLARVRRRVRSHRLGAAAEQLGALLGSHPFHPAEPAEIGATPETANGRLERLVVKTGNRARLVRADQVDWIEAAGVYVRLHAGGERLLLRMPMHELETRLDPHRFVRIHRSTIVNLDRVRELRNDERDESVVLLEDGTRLRLSRSRKPDLKRRLGQSL